MIIEVLLIIAGTVLAIGGLCEGMHAIRLFGIMNPKKNPMICVVPLKSEMSASQLNFAAEQQNWLGEDFAKYIIALTDGIEDKELECCKLAADDKGIILCSSNELSRIIKNLG